MKGLSGYDIPEAVELRLPNYLERKALVEFYRGEPETWTPENGFRALVIEARNARQFRPWFERAIAAQVFGEWLAENMSKSLFVGAQWARGDSSRFDAFWAAHEIELPTDTDVAALVARLYGEKPDVAFSVDCGGGDYGLRVEVYGHIVVAIDTEHHLWVFPEGCYDADNAVQGY